MTKIVCLHWLTLDIFNYKPLYTVLNYMGQFFEISIVYHWLYLWNEDGDPHFFYIFDTSNSLSACSKNLKKFAQTSLKLDQSTDRALWYVQCDKKIRCCSLPVFKGLILYLIHDDQPISTLAILINKILFIIIIVFLKLKFAILGGKSI